MYLMEHKEEGKRLRVKTSYSSTKRQLLNAKIGEIPNNSKIIDAGAGAGYVSKIIGDILVENEISGCTVCLVDQSASRLKEAEKVVEEVSTMVNFEFVQTDLADIDLPDDSADFVFSRFVFEYLPDQYSVFKELTRILKVKGRMLIGELDYDCMSHYGLDSEIEKNLLELVGALGKTGYYDPHTGRKLFSYFYDSKFDEVNVELEAHHLFYGKLSEGDFINWDYKLKRLIELSKSGELKLSFDLDEFGLKFMEFLRSERRFSYTPIILVQGTKSSQTGIGV